METQYSIIVTKRTPMTDEELDRIHKEQRFMMREERGRPPREYVDHNVLMTVLSEGEFLNVRDEVLKNWSTIKEKK